MSADHPTHAEGGVGGREAVDEIDGALHALSPPTQLLCPITYELMQSPVTCVGDGLTYSEAALRRHFRERVLSKQPLTSPLTNATLTTSLTTANHFARATIDNWLREHATPTVIARFRVSEHIARVFVALLYDQDSEIAREALLSARKLASAAQLPDTHEDARRIAMLEHYLNFFECAAKTPDPEIWRLALEHATLFGIVQGGDTDTSEGIINFDEEDDDDDDDDDGDADGGDGTRAAFDDDDDTLTGIDDQSTDGDYIPPVHARIAYDTERPRTRSASATISETRASEPEPNQVQPQRVLRTRRS